MLALSACAAYYASRIQMQEYKQNLLGNNNLDIVYSQIIGNNFPLIEVSENKVTEYFAWGVSNIDRSQISQWDYISLGDVKWDSTFDITQRRA